METVVLPDGRVAHLWLGGAAAGPVVLFFHGCPDSRRAAIGGHAAARELGVRLLAVSRPGYGRSTPAASSHASVADDATHVLDALGVDRVAALGMSVGGAYAAALAARHPDRVTALGVAATLPMPDTGAASVDDAVEQARPEFEAWVAGIDPGDPDDAALAGRWRASLPPSDAALLAGLPDVELAAAAREAVGHHAGYLRDAALAFRPWDVDVSSVACPTTLWYGEHDERALPGAAWFAGRIPQAEVVVRPATGHLATLVRHWPDMLARLTRA